MILNLDKSDYKKLKRAYNDAVKAKQDQFNFMGAVILTSYAKYLIEYLEPKFKK